ncbi:WD40-repeat-containing domain protein [Suillus paluster]|uniref:WD40-repeat-containing domain protein n=1 Tax=Suillus paluster TaxID=48578 RepID=UPI001B88477A|nr:WD40-repeat-containing domain protein [Suillus paluster]KAG1731595.1 WD40-repeat-containing domain protein [Suillus paluster]
MDVKVYTVNGAVAGSSSSIPDWLIRKRAARKGKRVSREHVQGSIELIQGFEFPEASNKIKTTRDGHHAIATGTYKPQTRVWDLDELNLKFERHSDAENVDFIILSDDWTKIMHLQNDRTIELHTQGGFHYRTRIPRFGRSLAYHFPSCNALFSASGNEIYRLNLEQGRFLNPLILQDENIQGVNCIDINPAHNLLAFGVDGNGSVQFWDPRSRSSVGVLRLPTSRLLRPSARSTMPGIDADTPSIGVTALASRSDGLSYAVGTSTGHTLLYDLRSPKPFALKDQGYGLPIKNLSWIEGSRLAGDGMVLSADKKVVKIWDRNSPSSNFVSITPATDLNHIHHVPGSGLFLTANEGIQMATYYVPALGPAPRWASFLENITEEMEDSTTRSAYEDYKFVERSELETLGLSHLIGTPTLKPYMHGYFLSLHLYDTARVIANPFAYAEHREKVVRERMEKMAESRIRAKKGGAGGGEGAEGVKVNKALAERIERGVEKERKREERKKKRGAKGGEDGEAEADVMDVDANADEDPESQKPTLLNDPRFKDLFQNPEFAVDENTREYALLHPSSSSQIQKQRARGKTAVEEEEEESEKGSSGGLTESESEGESEGKGSGEGEGDSDDSSDAGELNKFDPRARPGQKNERALQAYARTKQNNRRTNANVNFVPLVPRTETGTSMSARKMGDKSATFGQRRGSAPFHTTSTSTARGGKGKGGKSKEGFEMSWVPSSSNKDARKDSEKGNRGRKGVEVFGAGMERVDEERVNANALSESERTGRSQRRKGMRSGSRNVFRQLV